MALQSEPRLVELRERLAAERADGAPFGPAWKKARAEALTGLSRFDTEAWSRVLASTRWAWRSAYYGGPSTRLDLALGELAAYAADGELELIRYEPVG